MIEVWKDVAEYEGLYKVSNFGRVCSLNWKGTGKTRELSQRVGTSGYFVVNLSKHGIVKSKTVHRLVAQAFLENPLQLSDINHIDENKLNNSICNLEWCSHKENVRKFQKNHPLYASSRKSTDKYGKRITLPVAQYDMDGKLITVWANSREICKCTGMSDWSIAQCCRGKRKSAYGYLWQYAN